VLKGKEELFENIWNTFIEYPKDFDLTDDNDRCVDAAVHFWTIICITRFAQFIYFILKKSDEYL